MQKATKKNIATIIISFAMLQCSVRILLIPMTKFEMSCTFMLLYLCVTEILKDW